MSKLCMNCHYIGPEKADISGNLIYEFILWTLAGICFIAGFAFFFLWIFALVFFLLAIQYSMGRYKKVKSCPECGHDSMIPTHTPKAQEIISASNLTIPAEIKVSYGRWVVYLVLGILILGIFVAAAPSWLK